MGYFNKPLMNATDIYGQEGAERFTGVKANKTTAGDASGTIGSSADSNTVNSAFSWVAFVLCLVLIRVLEEFAPTR